MTMTPEQQMQVNNALNNPGIQLALPQTIQPVTKTQYQVQRTQYDPEKLLALKTALATPRKVMSQDEIWANALANYPEAKSYTGGFGEEIISPWGEAMSSFARSFGSAYAAAKADEREKAEQAHEDAIKAGVSKKDNRQYTLQYYSISKKDDDGKALDAKTLKKNKEAIDAVAKKAPSAKDFTKDIITDENNDQADDKTGVEYGTENLISKDMDSSSFLTKKQRKEIIKMKNGQITGVLETDDAYYVVKMVNNDDPATYNSECEQAIESEKESQFETKYKKDIKTQYTTEVQKYWSGRVKLGGITTSAQ